MKDFINTCKKEICKHEGINADLDDIFVVWSCKTIQNKKALIGYQFCSKPIIFISFFCDAPR